MLEVVNFVATTRRWYDKGVIPEGCGKGDARQALFVLQRGTLEVVNFVAATRRWYDKG